MKIIEYDKSLDKRRIADSAYNICGNTQFPVEYQDVYNHLFEKEDLIVKLLMNKENKLAGFGVFENYRLNIENQTSTMLYLSGMVIDKKYQGKNISKEIIKCTYDELQSDLISLRTQNIAMAKSLLSVYEDNLFVMPGKMNKNVIDYLRTTPPFQSLDENGIIKNCYPTQLYPDLIAIESNYGIILQPTDALGVVIEPSKNKQKVKSYFS